MSAKRESAITKRFKVYKFSLYNLKKSKYYFPCKSFADKTIQFHRPSVLQRKLRAPFTKSQNVKKLFSSQKPH